MGRDQEDPLELVEQLVRLDTELEESRHVVGFGRFDRYIDRAWEIGDGFMSD